MQETNLSSGLATAAEGAISDGASLEALQSELSKWQARVPKLAGALRERTNEVAALKAELAARPDTSAADGNGQNSGIQARDKLIEELEAKVKALGGKYQDAEGQLHARDLEIAQLRQEAAGWREKWQSVTSSLDQQADSSEQKDRELNRMQTELNDLLGLQNTHNARIKEQDLELTALRERAQSLESRNENLFETTELANRQIETLGENLEHLRAELKACKRELADKEAAAGGVAREIENLQGQIDSRDQDIEFLHGHVAEKQQAISTLEERTAELEALQAASAEAVLELEKLNGQLQERDRLITELEERLTEFAALKDALEEARANVQALQTELDGSREAGAAKDAELSGRDNALDGQKQEIRHLEDCVAKAEEATGRFEAERRQLSEQLDELRKRNEHLEDQLSERSDLVVGLEQEKSAITDRSSSLETENQRLAQALEKSQQAAAGNADHIAQVDARMERQKQLMENLEAELAEVQEDYAAAVKAHQREMNDRTAELEALRERLDENSLESVKGEMNELETALQVARTELSDAQRAAGVEQRKAEDLARELDQRKSQEDAALVLFKETVEKLEKQLAKQSRETQQAEEAGATARAALEAQTAAASREPDELSGENEQLQAEVIKLEGMVRERTEQLNKLRWQQDMIEKQASGDGADNKMLVVLNQQLASAREDNQRLREKLREMEARSLPAAAGADLSSIRGIGPKLVKRLRKLGITEFDQIATLSEADLDDVNHPLHGMKGRILKDNWIAQAAKLGGAG